MSEPAGQHGAALRCPFCGARLEVVHVHGHGQCAHCGTNVDPCCAGASAGDEADQPAAAPTAIDPDLFPRLFRDLGGDDATVTLECVLTALSRAIDGSLEDARIVLDAGLTLGQLQMQQGRLRLAPKPR